MGGCHLGTHDDGHVESRIGAQQLRDDAGRDPVKIHGTGGHQDGGLRSGAGQCSRPSLKVIRAEESVASSSEERVAPWGTAPLTSGGRIDGEVAVRVETEVVDDEGNVVVDDLVAAVDGDGNIVATDETITTVTSDGDVVVDETIAVRGDDGRLHAVEEDVTVVEADDEE